MGVLERSDSVIAEVLAGGHARDLLGRFPPFALHGARAPGAGGPAEVGTIIHAEVATGAVLAVLAGAGTARAEVYRLAASEGLDPLHPPAVEAEAAAFAGAAAGLDDPSLVSLEALPFVTIDGAESRDLDQALHVEHRADDTLLVHYALADASYFVRPGTALFDEALLRGASFYLPGLVVPMLPRVLSEGLTSLNPDVARRALVFRVVVDREGGAHEVAIFRARIKSQRKLSFGAVQRFFDGADATLTETTFAASLRALKTLGERRLALAEVAHVVRHARRELTVGFVDPDGRTFVAFEEARLPVETWNEQLSVLINVEGARALAARVGEAGLHAIFRVHPAPEAVDVARLAATVRAIVAAHELDAEWAWDPATEALAGYLGRLRTEGALAPVARAIQRQALVANQRSSYSPMPGLHYGLGAPCYGRFTAPMREMVGIFTHKETLELLAGTPPDPADEPLQAAVIASAEAAQARQGRLTKGSNACVLDALFGPDLALPEAERPARPGTLLGLAADRAYVVLDSPPLEVKLYFGLLPGARLVSPAEAELGDVRVRLGDRLAVRVIGWDKGRAGGRASGRWCLAPIAPGSVS